MCYNIVDKILGKVGIKNMRKFCTFMRHFQLINCRIVVHAFNELMCMFRGESLESSFNSETIHEYMEDLKKGTVKPQLMGTYEYSCCTEYLKKIRRELFKNRNNFETLTLTFGEIDHYGIICCPLEYCLEMVAKEVGFEVIDEEIGSEKYTYTLKSTL